MEFLDSLFVTVQSMPDWRQFVVFMAICFLAWSILWPRKENLRSQPVVFLDTAILKDDLQQEILSSFLYTNNCIVVITDYNYRHVLREDIDDFDAISQLHLPVVDNLRYDTTTTGEDRCLAVFEYVRNTLYEVRRYDAPWLVLDSYEFDESYSIMDSMIQSHRISISEGGLTMQRLNRAQFLLDDQKYPSFP